ncbi:MAG: aminoacetone oxidase family FAD-binding enzyme, partial [Eubacteriales bacterium]|nr:aminoacetone oxidase family FAD-binding enzyme [Eubacteriales bacterium]
MKHMIYDLIIIGAGAAGLFAGASVPSAVNGLILEKKAAPGRKLLMSGGGQCNLTHGGSIKDFISHYGQKGNKIRSVLYQFNNDAVKAFFEREGVPLFEREDGKVFPKSLEAKTVVDTLVKSCKDKGINIIYNSEAVEISIKSSIYTVRCEAATYQAKKLVIATGGSSYPTTGSDGSFFSILANLGIEIEELKPALVPIYVRDYPYRDLAGIAFPHAKISVHDKKVIAENTDALLLTHDCFSGPAVLNLSRYAVAGNDLCINCFPSKSADLMVKELTKLLQGNQKQLLTLLYEYFNEDSTKSPAEMPKRFLEAICLRAGANPAQKSSQTSGTVLKKIAELLTCDRHSISRLGGYETAMVTCGGVALDEVNIKTLESKKYPNLYFAGESLDVDGDT